MIFFTFNIESIFETGARIIKVSSFIAITNEGLHLLPVNE